jgi:hypothetical protein
MELLLPEVNSFTSKIIQTELVQKQKQEYKHLGQYLRTKGLKIYYYNHFEDIIIEVEDKIQYSKTLHLIVIDNKLTAVDLGIERVQADPRFEYFEALNFDNAEKRVEKWKAGKIKHFVI